MIVLDLDDTLYLERGYVESGLRAVGCWAATQLGTPGLADAMVGRFRAGQHTRLFDNALEAAGIAPSPSLIARMLRAYRQHPPRIALAADAAAFLAQVGERTALAVITDGFRDAQKRKVAALDLHRRGVSLAICTDRWGREAWKPARRAFDHVAARFALPPDAFCYVADNEQKDFQAPRAMGWHTVRIARPEALRAGTTTPPACTAHHTISTFGEWEDWR